MLYINFLIFSRTSLNHFILFLHIYIYYLFHVFIYFKHELIEHDYQKLMTIDSHRKSIFYNMVWHESPEEHEAMHEASINRDQRAAVNSRVSLCCGVNGNGLIHSVRWTKNGGPVGRHAQTDNGRILTFERVQLKDTGRYECHIQNGRGLITSDYVNLTVTGQ